MSKLETKVRNMWEDFIIKNKYQPSYVNCEIIYFGETVIKSAKFSLFPYFEGLPENFDNEIMYYCQDIQDFLTLLADIDYSKDDFKDYRDFENEILKEYDKFDGLALNIGEDFCIVNVINFE